MLSISLRALCFAGSVAAHAALFVGLAQHQPTPRLPRPIITSLVELRPEAKAQPVAPEPEPEPASPPPPEAPPAASPRIEREPAKSLPTSSSALQAAETAAGEVEAPSVPLRLAGLRLSNAGPGGLAIAGVGGRGGGRRTGPSRPAPPAPAPRHVPQQLAPRVVALSDLSRRPTPPNLNAALLRHYPAELRRRGVEGQAMVRLQLSATGGVRSATLLSESNSGFGEACRRMLRESRWAPGLDAAGKAVETSLVYRCRFTVEF